MSQILSKLNSIKNKLKNTVKPQAGETEPALHSETPAAPTPVLKATVNASPTGSKKKSNAHKHRFIAFMRWLVGNASHVPALAKVLVTAAFFGSVMLVALSIFFLPFPRKKIQPPQHVRTSPSNFYPKPDAGRMPAQAKPTGVPSAAPSAGPSSAPSASPSVKPSATPSATPAGKPSSSPSVTPSPAATKTAEAAPAALPQVPSSVMDKVREGTTSQDRQKTTLELAQEYFKDGKRDMAFALLERTTGENPQWIDALFLLATEYRKAGRLDPSSGALLRILQVEPTNALAYNNLGMIQMRKKKPVEAIPYLERSFVLKQDAPETPLNLGIAYEQTLTWGKAVAAYEHYLKLVNPNGGLSKDKVINAVKFRMQRLKAFARAQGTLDQGLDAGKIAQQPSTKEQSDDSDESEEGELPLATGPVVDPNPIQQPRGNGSPAAAVVSTPPSPTAKERAPAGVQTQLPTSLKGEGGKP